MMKAILVEQIGAFRLAEIPDPQPGTGEVLIKTAVTGLCRTDLKIIEVGHRDLVLPRVPGEEIVGTIHAVGSEIAEDNIGKRVYVYPGTSCGDCRPCLQGVREPLSPHENHGLSSRRRVCRVHTRPLGQHHSDSRRLLL
ncbi:alcohol dehydrogenase catalytic domain-containing protein [Desulfobulbus alkaliphilus]|uniref:alcohol dehydrogenase catalytic domain-containing protein n=1 Tax=Desulfobulbus alkaliphilus TaxID=869814 RepID=UPI0019651F14|nr:alcohol dehydrogenase catalytic domain-containing protein [Desulfobulbus alkaliphilus]MBM9535709.1 alcohol dehydrogenase catalytic domain-containing protein [Desulfobulbus alkaliphilus]